MPGPNPCLKVEHIWDAMLREIRGREFLHREYEQGVEDAIGIALIY